VSFISLVYTAHQSRSSASQVLTSMSGWKHRPGKPVLVPNEHQPAQIALPSRLKIKADRQTDKATISEVASERLKSRYNDFSILIWHGRKVVMTSQGRVRLWIINSKTYKECSSTGWNDVQEVRHYGLSRR